MPLSKRQRKIFQKKGAIAFSIATLLNDEENANNTKKFNHSNYCFIHVVPSKDILITDLGTPSENCQHMLIIEKLQFLSDFLPKLSFFAIVLIAYFLAIPTKCAQICN